MKHQVGEDTITTEKRLGDRKEIEDIPKRSTNLLYGIIIILSATVAFLVGYTTANFNWIDLI